MFSKTKRTIYLNYHNLGFGPQIGINKVNPLIFNEHVKLIDSILLKKIDLDIVLTFDDGYENIYKYAYKQIDENSRIIKKVFIIKDYIGKSNSWDFSFKINKYQHLNKRQILKLSQSNWEIGSHGGSHRSLLSMPPKRAKLEIEESKKYLEDIIGKEVTSIAPPFSAIDQKVYDICAEAGYKSIFIQKKTSLSLTKGVNVYLRKNIYSIDSNYNIVKKINSNNLEETKEKFISSFNNLTVFFSKIFKN